MEKFCFKITLLSDIVLSSSAANEGFYKSLNYIPGSKLLGLVASKLYSMANPQRSLDLFHNGSVRFGDAHPMVSGKNSYPIPFDWHYPKNEGLKGQVYLFHKLSLQDKMELISQKIQLKQARNKFITLNKEHLEVAQSFTIKSAYDRENLTSKAGQMYGYFHLKKGSKWYGEVHLDDHTYLEEINTALVGVQRIGRSSSAQYGRIRIEKVEPMEIPFQQSEPDKLLLYAYSNLCFFDSGGNNTLFPTPEMLGLPQAHIKWKESQIRTRTYRTWNKKRNARNTDLKIIEKGSVFSLQNPSPIDSDYFKKGIGSLRSEGFGQVILNPSFLFSEKPSDIFLSWDLTRANQDMDSSVPIGSLQNEFIQPDSTQTIEFLRHRKLGFDGSYNLEKEINRFIQDHTSTFDGVSSSQWGQIRNIARKLTKSEDLLHFLFHTEMGFLYTGSSKNTWGKKERIPILLNAFTLQPEEQKIPFAIKLASEMAKYSPKMQAN